MGEVKSSLSRERSENGKKAILALFWAINTVDSLYLEHPLSRTSLYLELKSQSLCVSCNVFFSLYLELSLSRTNFLVPLRVRDKERANCMWPCTDRLIKMTEIRRNRHLRGDAQKRSLYNCESRVWQICCITYFFKDFVKCHFLNKSSFFSLVDRYLFKSFIGKNITREK